MNWLRGHEKRSTPAPKSQATEHVHHVEDSFDGLSPKDPHYVRNPSRLTGYLVPFPHPRHEIEERAKDPKAAHNVCISPGCGYTS